MGKNARAETRREREYRNRQTGPTIRAELKGDDTCSALGLTVCSSSPVLALRRRLVKAGYDPSMPLEVYRGDRLVLRVKSIGRAAELQVNSHGTGFEARAERRAAPPMRSNLEAAE